MTPSKGDIIRRIAQVEDTLERLRETCPPGGEKWREGMIRYYNAVLEELKAMLPPRKVAR